MSGPLERALPLALAVALLGQGCAVPRWVPWIGKRPAVEPVATAGAPPAPGSPAEATTAAPDDPAAPAPAATSNPLDEEYVDRVIAVVNNDAVTLAELQESMLVYRRDSNRPPTMSDAELASQLLPRLIEARLQLQEALREKIVVEDAEIAEELADRVKRSNLASLQEFEAAVKQQGLTMEAVRKHLRESLLVAKLVRRKVALRVSVTDPEIDQYLDENRKQLETGLAYHARQLLITSDGPSDAEWEAARIRADLVRRQIIEGADFAEMARKVSRDASASDGGDLGTLKRGELAAEVEEQILALAPGEVSQPYRSALGYHLFKLESKEALEGEGLARARQQIRDILFRRKYQERLEAWIKEIRERAVIQVRM
jgi:peptidyl-prolyl cis-trans isomerase SurA